MASVLRCSPLNRALVALSVEKSSKLLAYAIDSRVNYV